MNKSYKDDIAYFIAFCVEIYKNARGLSGAEVSELFAGNGIYDYLTDNFDVLHTQGRAWLLEEISEVINHNAI